MIFIELTRNNSGNNSDRKILLNPSKITCVFNDEDLGTHVFFDDKDVILCKESSAEIDRLIRRAQVEEWEMHRNIIELPKLDQTYYADILKRKKNFYCRE